MNFLFFFVGVGARSKVEFAAAFFSLFTSLDHEYYGSSDYKRNSDNYRVKEQRFL